MILAAEPLEVRNRLAALGLTEELLQDAVMAGELERVSCTPLDPLSYPGTTAWGLCTRRLRERLIPLGWRAVNEKNLPLTVEPSRKVAIVPTSGNSVTGIVSEILSPTTKHPKGPMMERQVSVNQGNLLLFESEPRLVPTPSTSDLQTWLLLVYSEYRPRNEHQGQHVAQVELSLPTEINSKGWVTRWEERIILPEVRLDDLTSYGREGDEGDDEFDVPVSSRS